MPHKCHYPGCGVQEATEAELATHASSAHGADPLACAECGAVLGDPRSLSRHRNIHRNPHKYPCMVCPEGFSRVDSLASHLHRLHFQDIWQFALTHGYTPPGNQAVPAVNQPAPVNQVAPPIHQPAMANHFDPTMHHGPQPNLFPQAMHPTAPADHFAPAMRQPPPGDHYDPPMHQAAPADHYDPAMYHAVPMNPFAPGFQPPAAPMDEPMQMAVQQPTPLHVLRQAVPAEDPQTANQQTAAENHRPAPAN